MDALLAIQSRCPEAAQWKRAVYVKLADPSYRSETTERVLVAPAEGPISGFLAFRFMEDEVEITNLAVAPEARRKGIASRLVEVATAAASCSRSRVFIEVRESNAGAIAFYERHGFARTGRRPRYYADPVEDALILSRNAPEL